MLSLPAWPVGSCGSLAKRGPKGRHPFHVGVQHGPSCSAPCYSGLNPGLLPHRAPLHSPLTSPALLCLAWPFSKTSPPQAALAGAARAIPLLSLVLERLGQLRQGRDLEAINQPVTDKGKIPWSSKRQGPDQAEQGEGFGPGNQDMGLAPGKKDRQVWCGGEKQ